MPFSIPTLQSLINRVRGDIEAVLQNGAVYVLRSFETAIASALAGLAQNEHLYLRWISRQMIVATAEEEHLVLTANIHLETGRLQGTRASLDVTFTGTSYPDLSPPGVPGEGGRILIGDILTDSAGVRYEATTTYELTSPGEVSGTVTVQAVDVGTNGNQFPGAVLTLSAPEDSTDDATIVVGDPSTFLVVGDGSDLETVELLRARLILHLQTPPKGGAVGDYKLWALNSGVPTRVWEQSGGLGPGTVLVLYVSDRFTLAGVFTSTDFPGDTSVVTDYIAALMPVNPQLTVSAPTNQSTNMTIQLAPNTATVRAAVRVQIEDFLLRVAEPGGTVLWSQLNEVISQAAGETNHVLMSPADDIVPNDSRSLVTLNVLTFLDIL